MEGVKSGRSGTFKPDKLGLSCKANKYKDAAIGDLGVLITHKNITKMVMPAQPTLGKGRHKYKSGVMACPQCSC